MKWFFKGLRLALGPVVLLWEALTTPKGVVRPEQKQGEVDEQTRLLTLYQFKTCPFCVKVRREISRLSLNIALRDAKNDPLARDELMQGGGKIMTPCLKIVSPDGSVQWMYESGDIIDYLHQRFA